MNFFIQCRDCDNKAVANTSEFALALLHAHKISNPGHCVTIDPTDQAIGVTETK
jgi:hypothetical protein